MSDREARLLAAAQAFIAVTRGGILENNCFWTDLRDAVAAYPLQVVGEPNRAHPVDRFRSVRGSLLNPAMVAQHTWTPLCDGFHKPGPCP